MGLRKLLCLFIVSSSIAYSQVATVTLSASHLVDLAGHSVTGNLCLTPTSNAGSPLGFEFGGGGQGTTAQVCFPVYAGLLQAGAQVVDTALSSPANVCLSAQLIGTPSAGQKIIERSWACLQPASSGQSWCTTASGVTTCDLDNYVSTGPPNSLVVAGPQGAPGANGANGANGAAGATGAAGTNGNTIWNGTSAPSSGMGVNGDFYIDTATSCIYGPKASGAWPGTCTSLVGPAGAAGANGNTIWNGTTVPPSGTGVNGDFYLDTATTCLYGPKASGAWPGTCTSLTGGSPTAATPTFSLSAGTYVGAQSVTISSTTGSAVIWYNTTGTFSGCTASACSGATQYASAVNVAASETLYAIATESGYLNSAVASAAYTITGVSLINHVASATGTTSAISGAGGNFIAICGFGNYPGWPAQLPTDSSSNVYTLVATEGDPGESGVSLWVAFNPAVTASMVFNGSGVPLNVMIFSGVASGPDQVNGSPTNVTGSITPSKADELILSCIAGTGSSAPTGVTPLIFVDGVVPSSSGWPNGSAYEAQSAATPVSATWALGGAPSSVIASFYSDQNPATLAITNTNLPEGFVSTAYGSIASLYSNQLNATGGAPPYTFSCPATCALPGTLSISSSGLITGTPTASVGPVSVTLKVTDSEANTATVTLPLTVALTPFVGGVGTCTGSLLTGTQLAAYAGCALSASGGTAGYSFYAGQVLSFSGTTSNHSTSVTGISPNTNLLAVGMDIGDLNIGGIPSGTTITAIPSSSTITLSQAASASTATDYFIAYNPWVNADYPTLPEGMLLNPSTGAITGSVIGGEGDYLVQVLVQDSLGAQANLTLQYLIAGNNVTSCFPWTGSIFNTDISTLPVDTSPAAAVYSGYAGAAIRANFGASPGGGGPEGIPFLVVPYNQPLEESTSILYQSYGTEAPVPWYAPLEGSAMGHVTGQDDHSVIVQSAGGGNECQEFDAWQNFFIGTPGTNGPWINDSNFALTNISSTGTGAYAMPPQGKGSADVAGLPIAPLLVTVDEVIGSGTPSAPTGAVLHPIRFTIGNLLNYYVWPATAHGGVGSCSGGYEDGNNMIEQGSNQPTSCTTSMPSGEIYRLKASVTNPSCMATSPQAAIIATGMRHYGIILADNGESGFLIGTPDSRWNDSDLDCLRQFTLANFEPVNVSSLALNILTSYQVTPSAATPTFSPAAGTYTSVQTVTISTTTPSPTIYYTLDGSTPTTSSTVYSSALTVSSTETIKAIVTASGYLTSAVGSAAYTIGLTAATPTFNPVAGTYGSTQSVIISSSTSGATIWYNTSGTFTGCTYSSCSGATQYTSGVSVSASETLYAIATKSTYSNSSVATSAYTISMAPVLQGVWAANNITGIADCGTTGGTACGSANQLVYQVIDSIGGNTATQNNPGTGHSAEYYPSQIGSDAAFGSISNGPYDYYGLATPIGPEAAYLLYAVTDQATSTSDQDFFGGNLVFQIRGSGYLYLTGYNGIPGNCGSSSTIPSGPQAVAATYVPSTGATNLYLLVGSTFTNVATCTASTATLSGSIITKILDNGYNNTTGNYVGEVGWGTDPTQLSNLAAKLLSEYPSLP